jgi:DNA processing protein
MNNIHLPYWLAALFLPGIGPRRFVRWLNYFSDIKKLFEASYTELQAAGLLAKEIAALRAPHWTAVEKELAWQQEAGHFILALNDSRYPPALKEISDPPLVLYVAGHAELLLEAQLAIVGSRRPTPLGLANAKKFSSSLAEAGLVITSGLALGIDAASHQGALAVNGRTIGVCGTGLNHVYPPSHRALFENILAQGGAIISEFVLDAPAHACHFPRRNRVIGGLSLGVLVVEAALKSGSLVTARHASEQGREVFAIPGSIHNPLAQGCHHLIREGAKLVETAKDILEEIAFVAPSWKVSKNSKNEKKTELSPVYSQLLEQIGYEITPLDVILWRSGLTTSEVSSILLTLELSGYIQATSGGYIRIV